MKRLLSASISLSVIGSLLAAQKSMALPTPALDDLTPYSYQESPVSWAPSNSDLFPKAEAETRPVFGPKAPRPPESLDFNLRMYESAMNDIDGRISKTFRIPPALKTRVQFWLKVYTLYDASKAVIFDALHPEVVYEVMDFYELQTRARSRMVYEIMREQKIKSTVRNYQAAFERLRRFADLYQKEQAAPKSAVETLKLKSSRKRYVKKIKIPKDFPNALERKIIAMTDPIRSHQGATHSWKSLRKSFRVQTGQRDSIMEGLPHADIWLGRMESIFESVGIPGELTRIALVESSFNPKAVSRVGAVGVWQFMEAPAKSYLIVDKNSQMDERRSPLKAGIGAAKMLRDNYKILKHWPLAVTAYHSGMRPFLDVLKRRLAKSQFQGLFDPCGLKSKLGWAGQNYYAEFLAILHAERYRDWFYKIPRTEPAAKLRMHMVSYPSTLLDLATVDGIPLNKIAELNPDVRRLDQVIPKGYFVVLPASSDDWEIAVATDWVRLIRRLNKSQRYERSLRKSGTAVSKKATKNRQT